MLWRDGNFETSFFSVRGTTPGIGPQVGVTRAENKRGSSGSVLGNTGTGGNPGATSVMLKTRKGLDPSRYGTYYISGNTIELRYANGKVLRHPFATDGASQMILGDTYYWNSVPDGWRQVHRVKQAKSKSRSKEFFTRNNTLQAVVYEFKRPRGKKPAPLLKAYLNRMLKKSAISRHGEIKTGRTGKFDYASATITKSKSGKPTTIYVRLTYGNPLLIQLTQINPASAGDRQALSNLLSDSSVY